MIDPMSIVSFVLAVVGGATVLFRAIAPLTKNKTDDHILKVLENILSHVALNKTDKEVVVKLKK